jgi:hypothetical protein
MNLDGPNRHEKAKSTFGWIDVLFSVCGSLSMEVVES